MEWGPGWSMPKLLGETAVVHGAPGEQACRQAAGIALLPAVLSAAFMRRWSGPWVHPHAQQRTPCTAAHIMQSGAPRARPGKAPQRR